MANPKLVVGRVLAAVNINGVDHQPDALVEVTSEQAKDLVSLGCFDPNPDAVAYCQGNGVALMSYLGHQAALKMIQMQGGVFGAVSDSKAVIEALAAL